MAVIREYPGERLPAIAPGPGSYMQTPTIDQVRVEARVRGEECKARGEIEG